MRPFIADVLTWPGNDTYITAIKAARAFGIPPSVLILKSRQPSDGWTEFDKKLAVAFQILEDETCSDCGVPIWLAHSDDKDIIFEVKSRVCYSCAAVEAAQEKKSRRKPAKGLKRFLTTRTRDDTPHLPSRRKYLERQAGIIDEDD